jgi:N-acetylmuramoyl-L-alanine amidase
LEFINHPSPNFDERERAITCIVLHYTGMETGALALERLCDPSAKVSSHYMIDEAGVIYRLVDEEKRAWHAGVSYWRGERGLNNSSIGIEIVNKGHEHGYEEFPKPQIKAIIALCKDIVARHNLNPQAIVAHSDIAPNRKQDPGEMFPWVQLYEQGLGLYAYEAPILDDLSVQELQQKLLKIGYDMPITGELDAQTKSVVTAFQRHFRQECVDGIADFATISMIQAVFNALTQRPTL